ncbi:uncharacterized protein AAGF69_015027 isoform 1-T1 [Amazona ochrocephala]
MPDGSRSPAAAAMLRRGGDGNPEAPLPGNGSARDAGKEEAAAASHGGAGTGGAHGLAAAEERRPPPAGPHPPHRPRPLPGGPSPSPDPAPTGDPLVQWRLRRRAEEPSWGRLSWMSRDHWEAAGPLQQMPSSRSHDAEEASRPMKDGSHDALQRPRWRSGDVCKAMQPIRRGFQKPPWGQPCWTSCDPCEASECCSHDALLSSHEPVLQEPPSWSRDPHEAPQPIRNSFQELPWGQPYLTSRDPIELPRPGEGNSHEPLQQVPCARSRDLCEAPQPIRSSFQEPPWGQPYLMSRDPIELPRPEEGNSHEPLQQVPCVRSRDPRETPRPIRSCSQNALCQGSPLEDCGATWEKPSLRSRDPQEAPQPISSSSQDALQPPKDDSHAAPVDPILRLLRRRRRLLWQSLRAVDSALAALPHQSH